MSKDTALLVVDVQEGMFPEADPVYAGDLLLEHIQGLIAKARTSDVPVIYVQHNEGPGEPLESQSAGWNIHASITPEDGDVIIQKYTPDSFHETNLQEELISAGISKLVIAGIQTDMCVDATSHRASELGYDVTIAKDAHSTWGQGEQTAAQIIEDYNNQFSSFAILEASADIRF